jgi:hypothetical protein
MHLGVITIGTLGRTAILLIAGSFLLSACSETSGEWISHPIRDSLASTDTDMQLIAATTTARVPDALDAASHLLSTAVQRSTRSTIGALEGPEGDVIGLVADAFIGPDEAVYVLDGRFNDVKIFDPGGNYRDAFGGPGRGPGEIAIPQGLTRDAAGVVYVADENLEVHRFKQHAGKWEFLDKFFVGFPLFDICIIGTDIFALGVRDTLPPVIHRFDSLGQHQESFAVPYRTASIDVRYALTDGQLFCSEDRGQIVVAFAKLPEIHAYAVDGSLLWVAGFDHFTAPAVLQHKGGTRFRTGMAETRDEMHETLSMAGTSDFLIVQVGRYTREGWEERRTYDEIDSYIVDPSTGAGRLMGTDLPLVADVSGSLLLTYTNDPFPQLATFSIGR